MKLARLLMLATAFLTPHGHAAEPAAPARPNIVIILTDDQGYADVGKFGAEGYATPNLEAISEPMPRPW